MIKSDGKLMPITDRCYCYLFLTTYLELFTTALRFHSILYRYTFNVLLPKTIRIVPPAFRELSRGVLTGRLILNTLQQRWVRYLEPL